MGSNDYPHQNKYKYNKVVTQQCLHIFARGPISPALRAALLVCTGILPQSRADAPKLKKLIKLGSTPRTNMGFRQS